jgi:hypothetical protein
LDLYFLDDLRAGPPFCTGSIITTSDMEMARSPKLLSNTTTLGRCTRKDEQALARWQ